MVVVINFGSQFAHLIARRVRDLGVKADILPFSASVSQIMSSDPQGIILSGGTSQLRNLDVLVSEHTGVPTYIAEDPLLCVVKGTGIALENLESYKRSILATK